MQKPSKQKTLGLVEWRGVLENCEEILNDPDSYNEDPPQQDSLIVDYLMKAIYGPDVWKYINRR